MILAGIESVVGAISISVCEQVSAQRLAAMNKVVVDRKERFAN